MRNKAGQPGQCAPDRALPADRPDHFRIQALYADFEVKATRLRCGQFRNKIRRQARRVNFQVKTQGLAFIPKETQERQTAGWTDRSRGPRQSRRPSA